MKDPIMIFQLKFKKRKICPAIVEFFESGAAGGDKHQG
jgi:hypothetical protein